MGNIVVTNNPLTFEKFEKTAKTIYDANFSHLDILIIVRDKIHQGHELLTHPLSGSIKPNETPYKSIVISETVKDMHFESLMIIESSISSYNKFWQNKTTPIWAEKLKLDFQLIDFDLIEDSVLRC